MRLLLHRIRTRFGTISVTGSGYFTNRLRFTFEILFVTYETYRRYSNRSIIEKRSLEAWFSTNPWRVRRKNMSAQKLLPPPNYRLRAVGRNTAIFLLRPTVAAVIRRVYNVRDNNRYTTNCTICLQFVLGFSFLLFSTRLTSVFESLKPP